MSIDPDKLHIIPSKPKHDSHADAIRQFEGDYECLSNTYKCLVSVRGEVEPYPSVEHALQASKTNDVNLKATVRRAKNAIEAKKIARVIKPTPEWRARSESILETLLRDKFRRNAKAREILVGTGRVRLIYNNSHDDRVWGVCGGRGDNKLGKLLDRVRADALAGKDTELWCASRFQLPTPLDVSIDLAVIKEGQIVAEPSFEGKPIVKMGKLSDNDVVMAHPSVSRFHALLVIDKTLGAHLVDLGASNGSFVNGRRLTPFVPEPIKAGDETLTFAKSKRSYTLIKVEADLREAKKRRLYASMSDPTASAAEPDPDSTIYVGNLDPSASEDDLREFFSECGSIASVRIPQDKETGKMRGIAFVSFNKHSGVLHALTLDGDDLKGKGIKVRRAESKSDNKGGPRPGAVDDNFKVAVGSRGNGRREGNDALGKNNGRGVAKSELAALEVAKAAIMRVAEASRAKAAVAESGVGEDSAAKRRKVGGGKDDSSTGGEEQQRKRRGRWGEDGRETGDVSVIKAETQNRNGGGYRYDSRDGNRRVGDDGVVGRYDSRKSSRGEEQTWRENSDGRRSDRARRGSSDRDSSSSGGGGGESTDKARRGDHRVRSIAADPRSPEHGNWGQRDRVKTREYGKNRKQGEYESDAGSERRERDGRTRRESRTEERRGRRHDDRRGDEARGRKYDEDRGGTGRVRDHDSRDAKRGGRPRYSYRSRSRSRDRR